MLYFDIIPEDITFQILLYLDVDNIEEMVSINKFREIISTKLFWANKLNRDNLDDYVKFLYTGIRPREYFDQYYEFREIEENIQNFIVGFKYYHAIFLMGFPINNDIFNLIKDYGGVFSGILGEANELKKIKIEYSNKNYNISVDGIKRILSEKEFKNLLILIELSGENIHEYSNLDELYELEEY